MRTHRATRNAGTAQVTKGYVADEASCVGGWTVLCLVTHPMAAYGQPMRAIRIVVIAVIGGLTAWLWIRLGLYGFGLPVGFVTLVPLALLGAVYARGRRILDLGLLLGSFAFVWSAFEAWTWVSAASDPAVAIPDWTPVPLLVAVALLVVAGALVVAARSEPG